MDSSGLEHISSDSIMRDSKEVYLKQLRHKWRGYASQKCIRELKQWF